MVTAALTAGRRAANARMTDQAVITRPGAGSPVFDPDTGGYTDPPAVTVYTGVCRVQVTDSLNVSSTDFGGASVNIVRASIHIPVSADVEIRSQDTVTITTAAHDPQLVGQVFTVKDHIAKSQATARRIEVERA